MHRQPTGKVALQPSSPTLIVATQPVASIVVQDSDVMDGRRNGISKQQPPAARDELSKLAPAGRGTEGPASQPCMHTLAGREAQRPASIVQTSLPEQGSTPTAKYMPTATVGLVRAMPTASSWPSAYNGRRAIPVYADSSRRHITAVGLSQTTPTAAVGIYRPSA